MKKEIFLLAVSLIFSFASHAQVTIGSFAKPNKGAILDLKQDEQGVSTKGLGLPRVKLISLMVKNGDDLKSTIEGADAGSGKWDVDDHIGLMVYNISGGEQKECAHIANGLYVWNGKKWDRLSSPQGTNAYGVSYLSDTRPQLLGTQSYAYRNFGAAGDWMLENMRYINNTFTFANPDNYDLEAKNYTYPNGDKAATLGEAPSTWSEEQGLLYSSFAVFNGDEPTDLMGNNPNSPKIQGICPSGWHIPSDYEWSQLEEELAKHPEKYSSVTEPTIWGDRLTDSPEIAIADTDEEADYYSQFPYRPLDPSGAVPGHSTAMLSQCKLIELDNSDFSTGGASNFKNKGGFNILLTSSSLAGKFQDIDGYGSAATFFTSSFIDDREVLEEVVGSVEGNVLWVRAFFINNPTVMRMPGDYGETLISVRCKKN